MAHSFLTSDCGGARYHRRSLWYHVITAGLCLRLWPLITQKLTSVSFLVLTFARGPGRSVSLEVSILSTRTSTVSHTFRFGFNTCPPQGLGTDARTWSICKCNVRPTGTRRCSISLKIVTFVCDAIGKNPILKRIASVGTRRDKMSELNEVIEHYKRHITRATDNNDNGKVGNVPPAA